MMKRMMTMTSMVMMMTMTKMMGCQRECQMLLAVCLQRFKVMMMKMMRMMMFMTSTSSGESAKLNEKRNMLKKNILFCVFFSVKNEGMGVGSARTETCFLFFCTFPSNAVSSLSAKSYYFIDAVITMLCTCKVYCFVEVDFLLGKVVSGQKPTEHPNCCLEQVDVLDYAHQDDDHHDHGDCDADHERW